MQTAAKLVLEPIFEADLDPAAHGYRPGRSGTDAIQAVHALLCRGLPESTIRKILGENLTRILTTDGNL